MTATTAKPLAGIRVLDFSRVLAGPYCSMLLGDLGADVVKIESPDEGDLTRRQGPPFHHDMGMTYLAANRNKRSVTLNLRDAQDLATARRLADQADVVLENFRPGVMAKLGLDYDSLSRTNPRLVYAALSGMGADGPDSHVGAFDVTIQAIGGYMSITGSPEGGPVKLGNSAMDLISGIQTHAAIMAALLHRQATGKGQCIETSLLENQVAFLANAAMEYLVCDSVPRRWGSEHSQQVPYKAFETADGWIVIGAGFQNLYERLVDALRLPHLKDDPRYATLADRVAHRDALYATLDPVVRAYSTQALVDLLEAAQVPCAPVNDIRQVFGHRQVQHRGMRQEVTHPVYGTLPQVGPAARYSGFDVTAQWTAPPLLGEHNDVVLAEWLGESGVASSRVG